jgi:hypothetical protein
VTLMANERGHHAPSIPSHGGEAGEAAPTPAVKPHNRLREQQIRSQVHYLGFRTTEDGREYTLRAHGHSSRLFVMLIAHRHFASGRVRFQDGPDVCCAKLARALTDETDVPGPECPFEFTAEDLLAYRVDRAAPVSTRRRDRRGADDVAGSQR